MRFSAIKESKNKYRFNCTMCDTSIVCRDLYTLNNHSGNCTSCCQKGRPYEHMFNRLKATARNDNKEVLISFEDYLELVNSNCHYCNSDIKWLEYSKIENGTRSSTAYYIDRKDSKIGYLKDNIVPCCTRCNRGKNSIFSYKEWYEMTKPFREFILVSSSQDWDNMWSEE